jgi:hypothetical protein
MKYHAQFPGVHHSGASVRGGKTGELFSNPTGTVPLGTNHFLAMYDHLSPLHGWNPPANTTPPGWGYDYCYHMDQGSSYGDVLLSSGDLNGNYPFSPDFIPRPNVTPARDRWTCFELMVEANTLGQADGRVGLWMDGTLIADHPGLRFRTIAELKARYITPVAVYASEVRPNQTMWYDDVVIATQYIGPMAGSSAPVITVPPTNRTVFVGQAATFSVTASGAAPLRYQWQTNTVNIANATNATYTTPPTTLADSGTGFRVIVTNSRGSVMSSVAVLTVLPPDPTPPVVSLTAPANGATVSNTVTVSATATDNVAVAGVQFRLDGVSDLGAEDTVSPYSISWDTAGAANGIHALTAVARDTAGNLTPSVFLTVTVTNTGGSIMGNNGEGTTTDHISDGSGSYINASRFLAGSSFTATVIKAKVLGITGKYQCALYRDNGGVPQALLQGTAEVTNPSTGWQTFPLTSAQAIQGGAYYWLAIWSDLPSPSAGIYCDAGGGSTRWTGVAPYGAWPDPITTTGGSNVRYCIYAEGPSNGDVLVNGLPSSWLIQYFGSTNAANGGPLDDGDGDGMNNYGEWKSGTNPTNRLSVLRISDWRMGLSSNLVMGWSSVTGKHYTLQGTTNLLLGFPEVVSNHIPATPPTNTHTLPLGPEPQQFYRVMVE